MSILELFCAVDDFWQHFAPNWHHDVLTSGQRQRFAPVDATRAGCIGSLSTYATGPL
jgi:hypothetical protein